MMLTDGLRKYLDRMMSELDKLVPREIVQLYIDVNTSNYINEIDNKEYKSKLEKLLSMQFKKRLFQQNEMCEAEFLNLYQDLANTGYAWKDGETSLHVRGMIQKGLINAPPNYIEKEITLEEVTRVQAERELKKKFLN